METKVLDLIHELGTCQAICNYCFNACLHEQDINMMKACIKLDKECAEICALPLSAIASDGNFKKEVLELCAGVCQKCADECKKHPYEHCQECARVCEKCAQACRN